MKNKTKKKTRVSRSKGGNAALVQTAKLMWKKCGGQVETRRMRTIMVVELQKGKSGRQRHLKKERKARRNGEKERGHVVRRKKGKTWQSYSEGKGANGARRGG